MKDIKNYCAIISKKYIMYIYKKYILYNYYKKNMLLFKIYIPFSVKYFSIS